jgi:hypothetical protein
MYTLPSVSWCTFVPSCIQHVHFGLSHDAIIIPSYTHQSRHCLITRYSSAVAPKMHALNFVSLCTIRPFFHPTCTLYPLSHYARFVPVAPIVLSRRKHAVLQFTITTKHLLFLSCMQGTRLNITDHLVIRQWEVLHTPKSLHVCALNHIARGGKHLALKVVFVINYSEVLRIGIQIRIKLKDRIRIRIRIKVISWIRIRINMRWRAELYRIWSYLSTFSRFWAFFW